MQPRAGGVGEGPVVIAIEPDQGDVIRDGQTIWAGGSEGTKDGGVGRGAIDQVGCGKGREERWVIEN